LTPKLYKAGEVCELVQVQLYVLRSWEKEFPGIGIQKSPESPRLYRQSDLDHVQQIKQLVFGEGLTVSGARRRLDETMPVTSEASSADAAEVLETLGSDARSRLTRVRDGLREIRSILSDAPGPSNGRARLGSSGESNGDSSGAPRRALSSGAAARLSSGSAAGRALSGAAETGKQREFELKPPSAAPARAKARPAAAQSKAVKRGAVAKAGSASAAGRKKAKATKSKRLRA
jgi:DNA-binding transcriptional MerR regulator